MQMRQSISQVYPTSYNTTDDVHETDRSHFRPTFKAEKEEIETQYQLNVSVLCLVPIGSLFMGAPFT